MSVTLVYILAASIAVMIGELLYRVFKKNAPLLPRALAVLAAVYVIYLLAPGVVESRGGVETRGIDETAAIVLCYLAMLCGMMAGYGYELAERAQAKGGNRKLEFDLMSFLMPIFASPIVFIPLLTLTSEVALGGAFTRAKLMVYLVAFQNGFFWRSFFERRRREIESAEDVRKQYVGG